MHESHGCPTFLPTLSIVCFCMLVTLVLLTPAWSSFLLLEWPALLLGGRHLFTAADFKGPARVPEMGLCPHTPCGSLSPSRGVAASSGPHPRRPAASRHACRSVSAGGGAGPGAGAGLVLLWPAVRRQTGHRASVAQGQRTCIRGGGTAGCPALLPGPPSLPAGGCCG